MKRYNWDSLTDEKWEEINMWLCSYFLQHNLVETKVDRLMELYIIAYKKIRSKWLKPYWIKNNAQPFFSRKLNTIKEELKGLRRKFVKHEKKKQTS